VTMHQVNHLYAYDRANRLRSVTNRLDATRSIALDYDANGNRTAASLGKVATTTDANGNPVLVVANALSITPYAYGIRDELLQTLDAGGFVSFDYDSNGNRVQLISGVGVTRYLYDSNYALLEYSPGGQTTLKYNYGDDLLTLVNTAA